MDPGLATHGLGEQVRSHPLLLTALAVAAGILADNQLAWGVVAYGKLALGAVVVSGLVSRASGTSELGRPRGSMIPVWPIWMGPIWHWLIWNRLPGSSWRSAGRSEPQRSGRSATAERPRRLVRRWQITWQLVIRRLRGAAAWRSASIQRRVWVAGIGQWLGSGALLLAVACCGAAGHHLQWRTFGVAELGRFATYQAQPVGICGVALESAVPWESRLLDGASPLPAAGGGAAIEKAVGDKAVGDKAVGDKAVGDKAVGDKAVGDKAVGDKAVGDKAASEDRRLEPTTRFLFRVSHVFRGGRWERASGRVSLAVPGAVEILAGQRLRVWGQLRRPRPPLNPGGWDWSGFLRERRQLCQVRVQSQRAVERLGGPAPWPARWLDSLRQAGCRQLQRRVGPARASLAAALILGVRGPLTQERRDRFLHSGAMHMLAISGLHVGILVATLWAGLHALAIPRPWSLLAIAAFVVFYALLTECRPPVVRASTLVVLLVAARWLGRRSAPLNTLAAAGIVVLMFNPRALFQVGPQLSFLAVGTLTAGRVFRGAEDPLRRLIRKTRPRPIRWLQAAGRRLAQVWLATALVWLVTLPLVMRHFQLVAPAGLVVNVLLALPLTVALVSGLATIVLGAVPLVGQLLGGICDGSLWVLETTLTQLSPWVGGSTWYPPPPSGYAAAFYLLWATWVLLPARHPVRPWMRGLVVVAALSTLICRPVLAACGSWTQKRALQCTVLSVGHGTGVVCRLPDGRVVLYDAGGLGGPDYATETISQALWADGITRLDAIVVSHGDADHFNGVPGILTRFPVGQVLVPPPMLWQSQAGVVKLRQAVAAAQVPLQAVVAGTSWSGGESCRLTILHPPAGELRGSDNANSLVLLLEYDRHRVMLCGDLEAEGMQSFLARGPPPVNALLVPHHGSAASSPVSLARRLRPQWAIVSGGERVNLAAIEPIYREAGGRILHTARDGAVRVVMRPERSIDVAVWRGRWEVPGLVRRRL